MERAKDAFMQMATRAADTARAAGSSLVAKGKQQADRMALQLRLKRAQQRLGALVYSLHKSGESAESTVARCVQEMDAIREQMRALQPPQKQRVRVHTFGAEEEKEQPKAFFVVASGKNYPQNKATAVAIAPKTGGEDEKPAAKSEKT